MVQQRQESICEVPECSLGVLVFAFRGAICKYVRLAILQYTAVSD